MKLFKKYFSNKYKKIWRKQNKHNNVKLANNISIENMYKIKIGNHSYGSIEPRFWGAENESITIGHFCSIGSNVKLICGGNHAYKGFSTYPFKVLFLNQKTEALSKGEIIIEDDVWIASDVTILSGVAIGKGAVIGAGSVIGKNIPPYAIVVGNPAQIIKYRFSKEIIKKLLKFDFSLLTEEQIIKNKDILYTELNENNIDDILKHMSSIS